MTGIGNQLLLSGPRRLKPLEHLIHGAGELSDLVPRAGLGHASPQSVPGYRRHLGPNRLHGASARPTRIQVAPP